MKDIDSLLKKVGAASSAVTQIADTDRELRARHTTEVRARQQIAGAFEPADRIVANMCAKVDEAAAAWAVDRGRAIARSFSRSLEERGGEFRERPGGMFRLPGFLDVPDLCGLIPDLVKSRLETLIRAAVGEGALPMHDRARLISEADARIADIEATHTELVDRAADVGITIALLGPVAARRATEQARVQQEAAAIAARQQIEDRLNADAAAAVAPSAAQRTRAVVLDPTGALPSRPKAVRSAYVESGAVDRSVDT